MLHGAKLLLSLPPSPKVGDVVKRRELMSRATADWIFDAEALQVRMTVVVVVVLLLLLLALLVMVLLLLLPLLLILRSLVAGGRDANAAAAVCAAARADGADSVQCVPRDDEYRLE